MSLSPCAARSDQLPWVSPQVVLDDRAGRIYYDGEWFTAGADEETTWGPQYEDTLTMSNITSKPSIVSFEFEGILLAFNFSPLST
jgi:hypothetical protein